MEKPDTSETTQSTIKPKRNWFNMALIIMIIVLVISLIFLVYWFKFRPPVPWMFKGAYGKFYGETTDLFDDISVTFRFEVVDINSTHIRVLTYTKTESTIMGVIENQTSEWHSIYESNPFESNEFVKIEKTYEDYIYFEEFGTRYCEIFTYDYAGNTMIFYLDKEMQFPLEISINYEFYDLDLKITLIETNIPGLLS